MAGKIVRWLGWLLRVNRTAGARPRLRSRAAFARLLPVPGRLRAVHLSTIQRWEAGTLRAPRPVVARYEHLLGLSAGSLTSVFDLFEQVTQTELTGSAVAGLEDRASDRRLSKLLELACSSVDVISGTQWDELTGLLKSRPSAFLPQNIWETVAERLLMEMLIACGPSWNLRYSAFNRLVVHPSGQEAVIDVCASTAALRTHQVMMSTVAALGASDHPDSIAALVRQIESPTNNRAFAGAVIALAEEASRGDLDPDQQGQVMAALRPLAGSGDDLGPEATTILRMMADNSRGHGRSEAVRDDGQRGAVVNRVAGRATGNLGREIDPAESLMLAELVHTVFFDADSEIRLAVAALLAATPYRDPLAAAIASELATPATLAGDPEWSSTLLAGLRFLGGAPELRLVQRIVTANGIPTETVRVAAFALAHLRTDVVSEWWADAIDMHLKLAAARVGEPSPVEVLRGLTYSAGILGDRGALERIRRDSRSPHEARVAARWWLDLPSHVVSAARL